MTVQTLPGRGDRPAPSPVERIRFGIWSDSLAAAEVLQARLREMGQRAATVGADHDGFIECLVVVTQSAEVSPSSLATYIRLANRALVIIAVDRPGVPTGRPRDVTLRWSGRLPDLAGIAPALADLFRPAGLRFASLPILVRIPHALPGVTVAETAVQLVEQLSGRTELRLVPVAAPLYDNLLADRPAADRQDYDLRRLARWGRTYRRTAFIHLRLGSPDEFAVAPAPPRSLVELVRDPLTRRLVMLLGEPGSGKTQQLVYFDASSAYQSIRNPDGPQRWPNTFYVALAEQPLVPRIATGWLAEHWAESVDVARWIDFDQFLADGGTVLLDGLNEGGIRAVSLEEWMFQWLGVIKELFARGASKIIVSCRTRDLVIPMRAPRDAQPSEVNVLPLDKDDVVAIATEHDPETARRLAAAMTRDPGLVELYSNPFRLGKYLESGADLVATDGARLFGLVIAAVLRERDQYNFHGALIPRHVAAMLATGSRAGKSNPWSVLGQMPLIRALGVLAKALSVPVEPDGAARLSMSPEAADEVLVAQLARWGGQPVDPGLALQTARDLHILTEERGKIHFTHPSMQHLFAALACSLDELVELARAGRQEGDGAPRGGRHRYDELFQFAAQLHGFGVPERLLAVDSVLAARVYLSIRSETDPAASDRIVSALLAELDGVTAHLERTAILTALGRLGWALPGPRDGGPAATTEVPAGEWRLGRRGEDGWGDRRTASELRTIELAGFRVSRFPVSNAEFGQFVDDGGYDEKSFWTPEGWEWRVRSRTVDEFVAEWTKRQDNLRRDLGEIVERLRSRRATPAGAAALLRFARMPAAEIAEHARSLQARPVRYPRYWHHGALRNPLQPVVGVSWFEANAFCKWLSDRLGAFVRLPSENEWEAACLHSLSLTDASAVDSGLAREFGNTLEIGYAATTPIGAFVTRTQQERQLPVELMGNVFEWVFDYYSPGDHNRRILKGGSWRHEGWRAHPTYRGRGDVDAQNDDIGFRYLIVEGRS